MTTPRLLVGGFLIIFGIALLLGAMAFKLFFVVLLVFLGVRIMFGTSRKGQREGPSSEDRLHEIVIVSPLHKTITSQQFTGGKVVLIFSGGELDLSHATLHGAEVMLEVEAIFSGLKIIVPKYWRVRTHGAAIGGGYDNKAGEGEGEDRPTLTITGTVLFGNVEIAQ